MKQHRCSGILLAVSSLPGSYGIGSLGASARKFVDFLAEANQHYWQILPLVPSGDGASPYMSPSAFAGNPYLIDLDELAAEGLLTTQELDEARWSDPDRVNYGHLAQTRLPLLQKAWARARMAPFLGPLPELPWLDDYAQFAALHDRYQAPFWQWPTHPAPPTAEELGFHLFLQETFYRQWLDLKSYANRRGVHILGDIPFYLSPDSVEVWKHPELFQLDAQGRPTAVAGVPPDAFTAQGQLWGNPLYDWTDHKQQTFDFWEDRIRWCARIYDAVRIDHFRALHSYWSVPAGAESARQGHWEDGPGIELLDLLRKAAPALDLIAEDLGDLGPESLAFVRSCGIPGMKVMVFAFDPEGESAYLPHNCEWDSVTYTGTHDTPTFVQWLQQADQKTAAFAWRYLRLREDEGLGWGVVSGAWATASRLAIAPIQDVLGLGGDARMNTPGTMNDQNWTWRVRQDAFNPYVTGKLSVITRTYRR